MPLIGRYYAAGPRINFAPSLFSIQRRMVKRHWTPIITPSKILLIRKVLQSTLKLEFSRTPEFRKFKQEPVSGIFWNEKKNIQIEIHRFRKCYLLVAYDIAYYPFQIHTAFIKKLNSKKPQ